MVSCGRGVSVVCLPCGGSEDGSTMRWMPVAGSFAWVSVYVRSGRSHRHLSTGRFAHTPRMGRQGAYKHNWCINVLSHIPAPPR